MPVEYEPSATNVTARYANGVTLVLDFLKTPFKERPGWVQSLGTCPVRFVGEEGSVEVGDSGGIEVKPDSLRAEVNAPARSSPRVTQASVTTFASRRPSSMRLSRSSSVPARTARG